MDKNKTRRRAHYEHILQDFQYDQEMTSQGVRLRKFNTQQVILPESVDKQGLIRLLLKEQVKLLQEQMALLQRMYVKYETELQGA